MYSRLLSLVVAVFSKMDALGPWNFRQNCNMSGARGELELQCKMTAVIRKKPNRNSLCTATPPPLRKNRFFLRGGGGCTQAKQVPKYDFVGVSSNKFLPQRGTWSVDCQTVPLSYYSAQIPKRYHLAMVILDFDTVNDQSSTIFHSSVRFGHLKMGVPTPPPRPSWNKW